MDFYYLHFLKNFVSLSKEIGLKIIIDDDDNPNAKPGYKADKWIQQH
jgi:hypothetical protein